MTQGTVSATTSQDALNALLAEAMPPQGCWGDEHYLWLTDHARRLLEFTDGRIEVLPMPTERHGESARRVHASGSSVATARANASMSGRSCVMASWERPWSTSR